MNVKPYPIYVISLKRTPERRLHIQRQLNALNLDYSIVDAIDKNDLRSPQYRAEVTDLLGIDKTIIEIGSEYFFRGHLACALSHVKAYNLIAKHNDSVACILEDDAQISPDFGGILSASQKISWDILMLSSQSEVTRIIIGRNPNIRKSIMESPDINCSIFPKLKRTIWFRGLFPPIPISSTELNWSLIPKLQWWLLMYLSSSANRFRPRMYNYLSFFKHIPISDCQMPDEPLATCIACKMGGLPVRSSQQTLYKGYDAAIPAELPTSAMAYLITSVAANKYKKVVNSETRMIIDHIPWHLYKKGVINLKILTPPCVTAPFSYLKNSARHV